jgi:FkbM family methyltransferase
MAVASQLFERVSRDCDEFIRTPSPETAHRLQQLRLQMAESLAALPPGSLPASWDLFARSHARLMSCGLRDFVRAPYEDQQLERLRLQLAKSAAPETSPQILLAAMLLARNFEMPIVTDVEQLPDWFRPTYFALLLESPQVFNQPGEVERYVDFLEELTEVVHRLWVRTPNAHAKPAVRELATLYATRANLTQAYFSPRNLRTLYEKRGEIISTFLVSQGVQTLAAIPPDIGAEARKIKLGIFAHRFTPGTETYFTLSHFEHLDRQRFEVTLYALASSEHPLEQYCASRADRMVILDPADLSSQVRKIRADRLDILLISTNMTTHTIASTLLGSVRLAPIQVASVSSPVTTGARHTDVLLSAAWNEPASDAQQHYTEHLELLPGSVNYYAYNHDHDPVTIDVSRERLGIPADALVFFSAANFYKIVPELSESWAKILAAVPNSILLLMPFNPNWGSNYQRLPFLARIQQQLRANGVAPDRLRVIETVPTRADVHCIVGLADIYLDAYPFAGACSMLDSILAGVPAVVRRGGVGRSNHGAALLRMVGLDELSCDSDAEYIGMAIALANSAANRNRIREHLRTLKQETIPVYYDTPLFASRVGTALERLHEQYRSRYENLAADGVALRRAVEQTASRLIGQRPELNALTDIGIVHLLIEPYFSSLPGPGRMLDVGACHGAMSEPLLARGWQVDLLEPDPAAREVLQRNLGRYAAQIRVHALAAGSRSAAAVPFHQAALQGLSGLGDSPFAATTNLLQVPCVTLADFCAQQAISSVDFLKIDAEGYDFDVLASLDFQRVQPELVLIEYGTHFPRQTPEVINRAIADMQSQGNFKRSVWVYRLTGLYVDRPLPEQVGRWDGRVLEERPSFGNILFYRADNPRFLLTLQSLLDSCDASRWRHNPA